jgi:hypothetical protein
MRDPKHEDLVEDGRFAQFFAEFRADRRHSFIQARLAFASKLFRKAPYMPNEFWRAKELNIGYGLFQIISDFS